MRLRIYTYKAKDGWRWHMKSKGRIIAESGEGYRNKEDMMSTLSNMLDALFQVRVTFVHRPAPKKK